MPTLLRFSWTDNSGGDETEVTYRLEPTATGTRLTYEHTGFTGVGGAFMAALLGRIRRKMLRVGLPAVLADLDDAGHLRPSSTTPPSPDASNAPLADRINPEPTATGGTS